MTETTKRPGVLGGIRLEHIQAAFELLPTSGRATAGDVVRGMGGIVGHVHAKRALEVLVQSGDAVADKSCRPHAYWRAG